MTENTIADSNAATAVLEVYHGIEDGVVGTYKKIENGVTGAYKNIEDSFVKTFLQGGDESQEWYEDWDEENWDIVMWQ